MLATQISVNLAVGDGNAAIDFYKSAFGAELLWHLSADFGSAQQRSFLRQTFFVGLEVSLVKGLRLSFRPESWKTRHQISVCHKAFAQDCKHKKRK